MSMAYPGGRRPAGEPYAEITLQPPPGLPRAGGGQGMVQLLFMLPMMLGMGAMSFVYIGRSGGVMTYLFGALFLSSMVGMLVMSLSGSRASKKAQINDERRDYLRYLGGLRGQVREVAQRQREEMRFQLPDPADLWAFAGTGRLWERGRRHADFARVRIATGPQRLATPLRAPQTAPLEDLDPVASTSLKQFIRTYATVQGLPVAVSLRSFARVTISGERADVLDVGRAILAQIAAFHSPQHLRVACCVSQQRLGDWEWLKWLPHAVNHADVDAAGPVRLCAGSLVGLAELLGDDLGERPPFSRQPADSDRPHLVVVVDGGKTDAHPRLALDSGRSGVTFLDVSGWPAVPDGRARPPQNPLRPSPADPGPAGLDLFVDGARLGMRSADGISLVGAPDRLAGAAAEALARRLTARFTPTATRNESALTGNFGIADLLGIGDPRRVDPALTWQRRSPRDRLRIPIGVDNNGVPVELDFKESAESGMGPHGLVIGATGSGKSELLRTLVTALAVTHSSESLNFALIDFKGGATFAGMAGMPHVCAVITNLSEELTLVDRMGDALRGEMVRRQELLRAAGNYASVRDYERAREAGAALRPLPSLLVIIDEFSELLSSRPEFIDLFVMIGRLGRSLAIHLMLASQRLEEGRLRGLDSHLSYRIGLRTLSASESRAVLGVPDAYELPSVPGVGYLKVDTTTLIRFKAAYVSGVLPPERTDETQAVPARRLPVRYTMARVEPVKEALPPVPLPASEPAEAETETVMGAMLGRLEGRGPAAYQIWLPPLGDPLTLDAMLPPLRDTETRGFCPEAWPGNGRLTVPVAMVDKPFEQKRDLLWADLSGAAGHAVVVGAPQSGKSTLLRTLVGALALTHTPAEVQFFFLDFGGGGLSSLTGLPHVSGGAGRLDADRCRRIVAEVSTLMADRERLFAERGIDSMASFRAQPPPSPDGRRFGDVFLFVDGWMTLRQEFEPLEEAINTLAARGLGYGIHVVISANRWMELRPAIRDLIGTQFELRLGDPSDSTIDRRAAMTVPEGAPGRGLTRDKLQLLTSLPRVDGRPSNGDLAGGVTDLVKRVDAGWRGPRAPQVRLLPGLIGLDALPAPVLGDHRMPLGISEADLGPVYLDFDADPHFIAFGDTESGKSALLRLIGDGIMRRYTPEQAGIVVVDYRRSLLGAIEGPHLIDYCGSSGAFGDVMSQVEEALKTRLPGPSVTAEQLRNRSWWKGPELFVLVDDYDLVATQGGNPLTLLIDFLPQARDVGLHVVIVRRSGGASRALYDPVIQRLRDLATPGLVMSGSKDEGALLGDVKPSVQPPGRGQLVSRRSGVALVQVAWLPDSTLDGAS